MLFIFTLNPLTGICPENCIPLLVPKELLLCTAPISVWSRPLPLRSSNSPKVQQQLAALGASALAEVPTSD